MAEFVQAKLEESNIANIGSSEDRALRKQAAQTDKELWPCGEKVGLEIWRVENKRTESDTPDFGVKRWPKEEYGRFFKGDSYIVLHSYKQEDKMLYDVHFWLGEDSSQDEIGVAAYKSVEIDDLLDDVPIQHREVMGHESQLFQSYFSEMIYMDGGIESGFRKVKPEEYEPRLLHVKKTKKTVRALQIPVGVANMNNGDAFILDCGAKVYSWFGPQSSPFEKAKCGALVNNIIGARLGKSKHVSEPDDEFWSILGGTADDVPAEVPDNAHGKLKRLATESAAIGDTISLFRLSDASGSMQFTKTELSGSKPKKSDLDSSDVFIVDAEHTLYIWVGNGASHAEKANSMSHAVKYLKDGGRPLHIPICRVCEGQLNSVFDELFDY